MFKRTDLFKPFFVLMIIVIAWTIFVPSARAADPTNPTNNPEPAPANNSSPLCPLPEPEEMATDGSFFSGIVDSAQGFATYLIPESTLTERINILLLGVDDRPGGQDGRTDTMMLATIDPISKTVGLLSIPRDLWVTIPGYGEHRINQAYRWGQTKKHPGGGPALLKETIEANLGVPIHSHILINFDGFRQIVDTLGGIEICNPETIDSATYYGYQWEYLKKDEYYSFVPQQQVSDAPLPDDADPNKGYEFLYIEAGYHTLDGNTALRYARSRASVTADFARVQRQQAVLMAIRQKALQIDMVLQIPEMWTTMSGMFTTDLELTQVIQLAQLAYEIPRSNIQMEAISHDQTHNYTTQKGARVLLPNRPAIQEQVERLFGSSASKPTAPLTQAEITMAQASQDLANSNQ